MHDLVHLNVIIKVAMVIIRVRNHETGRDFGKRVNFAIFWATRHGEIRHSPWRVFIWKPRNFLLAMASTIAREASFIRACNIFSEMKSLSLKLLPIVPY